VDVDDYIELANQVRYIVATEELSEQPSQWASPNPFAALAHEEDDGYESVSDESNPSKPAESVDTMATTPCRNNVSRQYLPPSKIESAAPEQPTEANDPTPTVGIQGCMVGLDPVPVQDVPVLVLVVMWPLGVMWQSQITSATSRSSFLCRPAVGCVPGASSNLQISLTRFGTSKTSLFVANYLYNIPLIRSLKCLTNICYKQAVAKRESIKKRTRGGDYSGGSLIVLLF
jgi:hypothetical protein